MVIGVGRNFFESFFVLFVYFLIFLPYWGIYIIFGHFRAIRKEVKFCSVIPHDIQRSLVLVEIFQVTKRSKVLFCYSSRYSTVIGVGQKKFEEFFVLYVRFLVFQSYWGIYVIFGHFRAVQKEIKFCSIILHDIQRSLVIFGQLRKVVKFCSIIRHDILRSLVQVEIVLRHFVITDAVTKRSKVLFYYLSRYSKGIYIIFVHLRAVTKRSKVLFCNSLRYSKSFWVIYVIFSHFWAVTKRSKVLFCYSTRYSKLRREVKFCSVIHHDILRSLVQVEFFLMHFWYCLCVFLDFLAILGNFRNIQPCFGQLRKEVKFCYIIRQDILRSLVQVEKDLRLFCIVYVCFLIFRPFWGISVIFDHFQAVTKKSFWGIYVIFAIFEQLRKEVKYRSIIRHDILRSLVLVEIHFMEFT
ncbi:hypothetical protein H5410_004743 [Solanum commersonii]|uniref:Uncharacterized protein n=1 Tax=Solanum commersonii TaxID=4109 RepID=A0A9J6A4P1_SOLCO|nr:hypothetical protein H5410_004743 [Solanum commersonii]